MGIYTDVYAGERYSDGLMIADLQHDDNRIFKLVDVHLRETHTNRQNVRKQNEKSLESVLIFRKCC